MQISQCHIGETIPIEGTNLVAFLKNVRLNRQGLAAPEPCAVLHICKPEEVDPEAVAKGAEEKAPKRPVSSTRKVSKRR